MPKNTYDYIIVGGGSAGCIVAARLAQQSNASVLLLEAGDKAENNPETLTADGFKYCFANDALMWDRMSATQKHCNKRSIYAGTGTGMGGSGSVNGMVYTPGDKRDFDQWPAGWQWKDVAPVFKQLESILDVRSREGTPFTEHVLQAAETAGMQSKHHLTDGDLGGFIGYNAMNFSGEQRRSSYVAFLKDKALENLHIETGAKVSKLVFKNKRALGLHYKANGRAHTAYVNKEIILSAGALETPKLLMLSGIGPKAHLESVGIETVLDAPGIGQNLQDHPNVCVFAKGRRPIDFGYPQVYGFDRMHPKASLPPKQPDTCIAMLAAPLTVQQSMYRMLPAVLLPPKLFKKKPLRAMFRPLIDAAFKLPFLQRLIDHTYGFVVILGKPESRGSIKLASKNPDDDAIVDPNYYADKRDLETLVYALDKVKKIAAASSLSTWGCHFLSPAMRKNNPKKLEEWIKQSTITTFHFCGTCAMGEDSKQPVNPDLTLKGVSNIRIADASVMPVIPVSAINASTMMIAYRAANFILDTQTH